MEGEGKEDSDVIGPSVEEEGRGDDGGTVKEKMLWRQIGERE